MGAALATIPVGQAVSAAAQVAILTTILAIAAAVAASSTKASGARPAPLAVSGT